MQAHRSNFGNCNCYPIVFCTLLHRTKNPQLEIYAIFFCRFASHFTLIVQFSRCAFTADISFSLTADICTQLLPSTYINLQRTYFMVGPSGLEPPTSRLSGARSNHLSYEPTSLPATPSLSFNSIEASPASPLLLSSSNRFTGFSSGRTRGYSIEYSRLLTPFMVEISGIEPLTPCLQSRCSPS